MAEGFNVDTSGLRSWWNENANWGDQTYDRLAGYNTWLPETLATNYGTLAEKGIYGDTGIDYIMKGSGQEQSLARKAMADIVKRRYSKRLGSRAGGAAELAVSNEVFAPLFAEDLKTRRGLRQTNLESRLSGLAGLSNLNSTMAQQFMQLFSDKSQQESGKAGVLDWMTGLAGLGQAYAGIKRAGKLKERENEL